MIDPTTRSIQIIGAPPRGPGCGLLTKLEDELDRLIGLKHATVSSRKLGEMRRYFTTLEPTRLSMTPIERIGQTFALLPRTERSDQLALKVIGLAFEQHLENPEQFNSHGFDHSINVAERTQEALDQNPELLWATQEKYGMTAGEARFVHDLLALLHDAGYPHLGCRGKSAHGIDGGDLISRIGPLLSDVVSLAGYDEERLFEDFREAVQLHSADKVDGLFECQLQTSEGVFLANLVNLPIIFKQWANPTEGAAESPRFLRRLVVPSEDDYPFLLDHLQECFKIYQIEEPLPDLEVADGLFSGRFADLKTRKDGLLGLPFTELDLLEYPLQGMIRLTDNMDMAASRLSPIQVHPAFRAIWTALGDDSATGIENQRLERLKDGHPREEFEKSLEKLPHIALNLTADEKRVATFREAVLTLKRGLIRHVLALPEFADLHQETIDKIWQIGMEQSSYDLRHFGGSLAIKKVELTQEGVIVTVDDEIFEEMNQYPPVHEGGKEILIGLYHVWRAEAAYASLSIGGRRLTVYVKD